MAGAKLTFIPDILEEHVDEIAFLWGQRQEGLRSPEYTYAQFLELESRIAAHLRGVQVLGERALPLLEERLPAEDALDVFAAAFGLLHAGGDAHVPRLLAALGEAEGARRDGLRMALAQGPLGAAGLAAAWSLLDGAPAAAVAAAEVLAFHSALRLTPRQLEVFLAAEDAVVRAAGWRIVGCLLTPVDAKLYARALRDDDAAVRNAALLAGAWCAVPGVPAAARAFAADAAPEHAATLYLLAVLGAPDDLALFQRIAADAAFGPERFRLAAAYGHPALVDAVLAGMAEEDPAAAAAAGAAFLKLTGVDVFTGERARAPVEGGDEVDAEFADEFPVPDVERARREWAVLAPRLGSAPRICRGLDLGQPLGRADFDALDMESRWELCLRGRFHGTWAGSPLALERFPLPR